MRRKKKTKGSLTLGIRVCVYAPHEVQIVSGPEIHQTHRLSQRIQGGSRSGYHPEPETQEEAKSIRSLGNNTSCLLTPSRPERTQSVGQGERCQPTHSDAFGTLWGLQHSWVKAKRKQVVAQSCLQMGSIRTAQYVKNKA